MKLSHSLFAAALTLGGAAAHAGTFEIAFDNHCDGMKVTVANGIAYGTETGCVNGPAVGTKGKINSLGNGSTMNLAHVANAVFVLNTTDKTYTIYTAAGSVLESGTYRSGAPSLALGEAEPTGRQGF